MTDPMSYYSWDNAGVPAVGDPVHFSLWTRLRMWFWNRRLRRKRK